jgi:hypothetical protein
VRNDGPSGAANVVVEHFLSLDNTVQTTDLYLGRTTLALLTAGQEVQTVRHVQLPHTMQPLQYFLLGVVDRSNSILELYESNNLRLTVVIGQAGACTPALEYRDDLHYPRDAAELSVGAGGSLRPTVIARCAPAGSLYLIAWGFSGTAPGTPLAPGVTVPLNGDILTTLGLESVNGPVFQQFLGTLDATGIGRATFAWPAGLGAFAITVSPPPATAPATKAYLNSSETPSTNEPR